jgi:hypothetical protein
VLTNFLAGLQIAMTQPIRIDDSVIVENEWGNVEEITFSYVVLRLWDWRRMVVPLSYFIEKPFQNYQDRRRADRQRFPLRRSHCAGRRYPRETHRDRFAVQAMERPSRQSASERLH